MNNWIPPTTALHGQLVDLLPLDRSHFPDLLHYAHDPRIWEFLSVNPDTPEKLKGFLEAALEERDRGTQHPFVIYHKGERKLIGSTRLMDVQPQHRKLEIGWTWLDPKYWASAINPECKLLLLTYSFETLGALRVQLRTNEHNHRSRKAIAKIGAQYEGILRNEILQENGYRRSSAYFSIIDTEWPAAKLQLQELLQRRMVRDGYKIADAASAVN